LLGRIRAERRWQWSACGKHPAARDYFSLGDAFPLAKAVSEWMGRGYDALDRKKDSPQGSNSWRFWTREARRDHVTCGVLKDSCDGVGRPYPFLVMGTGPLPEWHDRWDLIPFACDGPWADIERLSTRSFPDVRALSSEVANLRQPANNWHQFAAESQRFREFPHEALRERLLHLSESEPFLCLDREPYHVFDLIGLCHLLLRSDSKTVPNIVFMGGTIDHTYLAIFRRALSTLDFVRMWTTGEAERWA
jgi:type VI secretion system protein VasJ